MAAREMIKSLDIWIMTDAITYVNTITARIWGETKRFFTDKELEFAFSGSNNDGGNHGYAIPFVYELRYNDVEHFINYLTDTLSDPLLQECRINLTNAIEKCVDKRQCVWYYDANKRYNKCQNTNQARDEAPSSNKTPNQNQNSNTKPTDTKTHDQNTIKHGIRYAIVVLLYHLGFSRMSVAGWTEYN